MYAFYGSLRVGMPLYDQFKNELNYQFSAWIQGHRLYSLGEFPCAVKSDVASEKIVVEFFEITDHVTKKEIDSIEIGYGYYRDHIEVDGVQALIYLFKDAANYQQVLSGDWVRFYRTRR